MKSTHSKKQKGEGIMEEKKKRKKKNHVAWLVATCQIFFCLKKNKN